MKRYEPTAREKLAVAEAYTRGRMELAEELKALTKCAETVRGDWLQAFLSREGFEVNDDLPDGLADAVVGNAGETLWRGTLCVCGHTRQHHFDFSKDMPTYEAEHCRHYGGCPCRAFTPET